MALGLIQGPFFWRAFRVLPPVLQGTSFVLNGAMVLTVVAIWVDPCPNAQNHNLQSSTPRQKPKMQSLKPLSGLLLRSLIHAIIFGVYVFPCHSGVFKNSLTATES